MLTEISPYTQVATPGRLPKGVLVGYRSGLNHLVWFSAEAMRWLGVDDNFDPRSGEACFVDVLPPAKPPEYRRPVFISEARHQAIAGSRFFGKGELLALLWRQLILQADSIALVTGGKKDNVFLLTDQKVGLVHWLSGYNCWRVHVTEDLPYVVDSETRIFALQ
jgi:hypothetical protein